MKLEALLRLRVFLRHLFASQSSPEIHSLRSIHRQYFHGSSAYICAADDLQADLSKVFMPFILPGMKETCHCARHRVDARKVGSFV